MDIVTFQRGDKTALTKNFSLYEFQCPCGCTAQMIDRELVEKMQALRDKLGKKVKVTSGYRCVKHNADPKVGGSKQSRHLYGIAADWRTDNRSVNPVALGILAQKAGFGGIGIYWHSKAAIVHTDTRGGKATWLCTTPGVYPSTSYNAFILPQKKFGYSRQTVRTALQQLENEGLITRVRGSGTYVSYEGSENNDSRQKVGLLLSYYSDYLFSQVYDGIESALKEKGYGIEVAVTKNRLNDEAIYLEGLLKSNVSGLIIEGSRSAFPNPNIRLYREIRKQNIPTLFIHNHYENQLFDSVEMEDARAAYELTKILIEHGHRRIGGIFKYDDMQGIERYKGFIQCLSDYGVKFDDDCVRWYSTKDMDEKLGKKGMLRMYRRTKDCTAMIVYNDEVAGYYMEFLADRGLSVPEDVSVVSFDDAELQQEQKVKLLSAVHPKYQLGRITAKNLLRMMEDENWQERNYSYRFPVKLNDGNSVRAIDRR